MQHYLVQVSGEWPYRYYQSLLWHFDKISWCHLMQPPWHVEWWCHPPVCQFHTAFQTQKMHQKFKWDVWSLSPYSPDLVPSDYFHFPKLKSTLIWNKVLETVIWKQLLRTGSIGRHPIFTYPVKQIGPRSDKCINRFYDYIEKKSASMPINFFLYFLFIVNENLFINLVTFFFGSILVL